jgi:hypothetical protein
MIRKILTGAAFSALLSTTALADNVLIIGGEGDSYAAIQNELTDAGHTSTYAASHPGDITGYDQVWDMRINRAINASEQAAYDTFLKNNGYLYLAGENSSFAVRNNSISEFTSSLGGGTITVGGYPSNAQDGNDSYFSNDTTVDFIAAATITTEGGRVLAADAYGNATAMMWIGNAGDLGEEYNGTVVVIADINWTQSNFYDANNQVFLQELIGGIAEGTTSGTITDTGTGTDVGGGTPDPVVVSSNTETVQTSQTVSNGTTDTVTTVTRGATVRVTEVEHEVGETTTEQTVEQTTTHTDTTPVTTTIVETTPVTTETCTVERTTTTYDDNSTTTSDSAESCSSTTTDSVVTTENTVDEVVVTPIVDVFTGRIDQLATAQDITSSITRGLTFNGVQGIRADHEYKNGMSGSTSGVTIGGTKTNDNGIILGAGFAKFSTSIDDNDNNSATADTTVLDGSIGRTVDQGTVTFGIRHGMTDYTMGRTIGPWTNTGETSGTDTSARLMFEGNGERLKPVIGYTRGKRTTDAYVEGGDSLTARSVSETSEMYGYGTVGGTLDLGLLDITALHHTDGVNQGSIGLVKETDSVNWEVRVNKTMTDLGDTNSLSAGISWKF